MNKFTVDRYEAVKEFGELHKPLRNIRVFLSEQDAEVVLVPEKILTDNTSMEDGISLADEVLPIIEGARPIVEEERCLRLVFESFRSILIGEEFVENFLVEDMSLDIAPTYKSKAVYPFLRAVNSSWCNQLSNDETRYHEDIRHYKILSMTTQLDLLALPPKGEWIDNRPEYVEEIK